MFRLFGLLLVGLVLAGCQSTAQKRYITYVHETSPAFLSRIDDEKVCANASAAQPWYIVEAKRRGLSCVVSYSSNASGTTLSSIGDKSLCLKAIREGKWDTDTRFTKYVQEAKRRGLSCGVGEVADTQMVSSAGNSGGSTAVTSNSQIASTVEFAAGSIDAEIAQLKSKFHRNLVKCTQSQDYYAYSNLGSCFGTWARGQEKHICGFEYTASNWGTLYLKECFGRGIKIYAALPKTQFSNAIYVGNFSNHKKTEWA